MRSILMALVVLTFATATAFAHGHRHSTHHHHPGRHAPAICAGCETVSTAAGIRITCDRRWCSAFQGLISDLVASGYHPRSIVCFSRGHTFGSNHDGGGACDFDQRAKNRTASAMYHAGAAIRAHGLHDGCLFRDCGHVEGPRGLCNYGQCSARRHRPNHEISELRAREPIPPRGRASL